jgi:hypothetical protein
MPILQDVLAKLKAKSPATGASVDLRIITAELVEAGYTDTQITHAIESLRHARVIDVVRGGVILL